MTRQERNRDLAAFCRRFAELKIAHWRQSSGLPKSRAANRREALWWLGRMKEYAA